MERCWCSLSQPARQIATNEIGIKADGMQNPASSDLEIVRFHNSLEPRTEPGILVP